MHAFLAPLVTAASFLLSAVGTEAFCVTSVRPTSFRKAVAKATCNAAVASSSPLRCPQRFDSSRISRHGAGPFVTSMAEGGAADGEVDPNEIVGRRIIVKGDVNAGYVRTCVSNEAGRFRRLLGTMSPPEDDSDEAEIYVEGKRKSVDGFIRWCEKGDKSVGLSQKLSVKEVTEEDPTGLYDGFYVRTGRTSEA